MKKTIVPREWVINSGDWHFCRICHKPIPNYEEAITSPRGSYYHLGCAVKSTVYRRALKKR